MEEVWDLSFDQVHQWSDSDCPVPAYPMMCDISIFVESGDPYIPYIMLQRQI